MHSWWLLAVVERRLGLPLHLVLHLVLASRWGRAGLPRSKHGHGFDVYGDVAQNDGRGGHQTRHHDILQVVERVLRSVWGDRVQTEAHDHESYSTYRPDVVLHTLGRRGALLLGDLKVIDPLGSSPVNIALPGSYVGFANTLPGVKEQMFGLAERGTPGAQFCPRTGAGYVAPKSGDYTAALANGCEVETLLFETFGGFSSGVVALLKRAAAEVENKLTSSQYDETSWSARTWLSFSTQQLSVAVHRAAAWELAGALDCRGVSGAADPRASA